MHECASSYFLSLFFERDLEELRLLLLLELLDELRLELLEEDRRSELLAEERGGGGGVRLAPGERGAGLGAGR